MHRWERTGGLEAPSAPRRDASLHPPRRVRTARAAALLGLSCVLAGCEGSGEVAVAQSAQCRVAQRLVSMPAAIPESSGAAMSPTLVGVFWTHNDSGGDPAIYAVDVEGRLVGQVAVVDAENVDWEDIAAGQCGSGACLYIADTGDNTGEREQIVLYRVAEPLPDVPSTTAQAFPMRFPDRPQDVEAVFVLPGERVYFVSKGADLPIALYRYPGPLREGETVELELVRRLSAASVPLEDRVTAADASSDGRIVALRTRTEMVIYDAEALVSGAEVAPANVDLTPLGEAQGEGLALGPDGAVLLTSEAVAEGFSGTLGIVWCPGE